MEIKLIREIFGEAEVEATDSQMQAIFDEWENDAMNSADLHSYTYSYSPGCDKCKSLEAEIAELEKQIECYRKSVMERRNASKVWIGQDGRVKYQE